MNNMKRDAERYGLIEYTTEHKKYDHRFVLVNIKDNKKRIVNVLQNVFSCNCFDFKIRCKK